VTRCQTWGAALRKARDFTHRMNRPAQVYHEGKLVATVGPRVRFWGRRWKRKVPPLR